MNDDAPPPSNSAAAASSSAVPSFHRDDDTSTPSHDDDDDTSNPTRQTTRKSTHSNLNFFRATLLEDLLTSLDILVFTELSVIYYMDCSTLLLVLRSALQSLHLTPTSHHTPPPRYLESRIMAVILLVDFFCILLHAMGTPPTSPNEYDRGDLHGGLLLDFIGQRGPSSRVVLVGLDIVVVGLQVVGCAGMGVRRRMRVVEEGRGGGQRLGDEERGVRRSQEVEAEVRVEVEGSHGTEAGDEMDSRISDASSHPGQIVLADFDLLGSLKWELWGAGRDGDGEEEEEAASTTTTERNRDMRMRLVERLRGRVGFGSGRRAASIGGEV